MAVAAAARPPEAAPATPRARRPIPSIEDRRERRRVRAIRFLFLTGLLLWSSLAAWWATYFYRSSLEVRNATLRAYAAEQQLDALEFEERGLDADQAARALAGSVFAIARQPVSGEERDFPWHVLRGRLADRAIIVTGAERQRLRHRLRRKMIMLAGEGSLLVGLLFACLVGMYRMLASELRLRRHQESFVHAVTHELKSPLTGLRSLLQSLATLDIPLTERASYVDLGVRELDRLDALVANILLSSRLEADAFRPKLSEMNLAAALRDVRDARRHLFRERGGDIDLDVPDNLAVRADPEAVEVILHNLFDNALKYALEAPRVRVTAVVEDLRVSLSVTDNGIGLDGPDRARVFRKFYRSPAGESRHAKGSGLGLFIARGLARSLHGDLTVASEGPGRGSTFVLVLPAA